MTFKADTPYPGDSFLVFIISFVLASFLVLGSFLFRSGGVETLFSLPFPGDAADYENLAFNLSRGKGFVHDFGDPEWRKPYEAQPGEIFSSLLSRPKEPYLTAYRSPLYPVALSVLYQVAGRDFSFARLFNFACIGLGIALLSMALFRYLGMSGILGLLVILLYDPALPMQAFQLLTEPLAFLLVSILFIWDFEAESELKPILAGLVFGLLILTRTMTALYAPIFFLAVVFAFPRRGWIAGLLFLTTTVMILLPWMVRNITVTGHFLPLGTQGGITIAYDYSGEAVGRGGVFVEKSHEQVLSQLGAQTGIPTRYSLEGEVAYSLEGTRKAKNFIRHNSWRLIRLVQLRMRSFLWWSAEKAQRFLLLGALLGALLLRHQPAIFVSILFVIANIVAVGLTHDVSGGRLLILSYPPLLFLASCLIGRFLQGFSRAD
jgi:hypothetical protein